MLSRMAAAAHAIDIDTHLSIVAPNRMDEPGFRAWFRRYTRSASSGISPEAFVRSTISWDICDRLPEIEAPVLVLSREQQTILPLRNARALAAVLPRGHLVTLSGVGTVIFSADVDKDLVAGSGIDFDERGTHALKGVPGQWRVFRAALTGRTAAA